MKASSIGVCAALIALAGCASPGAPFGAGQAQYASTDRAVPACSGSRIGQVQCGVLVEPGGAHPTYSGWTASELEKAYDLPVSTHGKGQIVAVIDAYDNPDAAQDLATYRSDMGLPKGKFEKFNQTGQQSNYPKGSPNWGVESDLDIEMVAVSCPKCTEYLVEADSSGWSDIEAAVAEAIKLGATTISGSYSGTGASCSDYAVKGVEFVASAGDSGYGIYQPAACDTVTSVGGTFLNAASNGRGYTETPWTDSGGGCATGEKKPWWQKRSKWAKGCHGRQANDVSAVAVGVAEYDSYDEGGWISVDGTSIGAPLVSGVFGLAGNATTQDGGRTFWVPPSHHRHLYEVGGVRYSDVGGWGSPKGIGAF